MGSCDCYFAWAEIQSGNTSSLVFFPPCSCQLRYTNMLAAAGRSLAKNPVCNYYAFTSGDQGFFWKLHLPTPCSEKHRLQSFSALALGGIQADKTMHSCHRHTVYVMSPERSKLPAASHWATGGTLTSHPWQHSSQLSSKVWKLIWHKHFGDAGKKRVKLFTFFIPVYLHKWSRIVSSSFLRVFVWVVSPFLSKVHSFLT